MATGRLRRATAIGGICAIAVGCGSSTEDITFDDTTTTGSVASTTSTTATITATTDVQLPPTSPPPPVEPGPGPGSRITWDGESVFRFGANLPWVNFGCDFGCGPSGGGASAPEVRAILEPALESAAAAGMNTLRWWLFPGDPWQISVDEEGLPTGIDERVYPDIDAALQLAGEHGMNVVFTLFSGANDMPSAWRNTVDGRARLGTALAPLFAHYAADPRLMTWQVVNEPEWLIWSGAVGQQNVQELVRTIASSVHANSPTLVSVGGARLDGLPIWQGLGLDYYTVHWYDVMTEVDECARCNSYADLVTKFGLDAPVVIGEFYLGPDVDGAARLADFARLGYAGSLAWSLLPDRTADAMRIDLGSSVDFRPD